MRPKFWFYPYNRASKSVWNLVDVMPNSRIIKREGSTYVYRTGDRIINWGNYGIPSFGGPVLNVPSAVEVATSKLATFERLAFVGGIPIPKFTTNRATALTWVRKSRVLGRDIDRGSEGSGITVYEAGSELGSHRFYVKYQRKQREFRVHVFQSRVIDVQEKLHERGGTTSYVRNTANGYIFARGSLETNPCPDSVLAAGIAAVRALRLDFGGVDIGYHESDGAFVYEVNTAPGIEGTTVQKYKEAFDAL